MRHFWRFGKRSSDSVGGHPSDPSVESSENQPVMGCDLGSPGELRLQALVGTSARAAAFRRNQVLDHLNAEMQAFVRHQEMAWIATADLSGATDCSFRAGPPGFVRVVDAKTLAYPEYRGNGVLATLANIGEQPHASLFFLDFFGSRVGLHVNGWAEVLDSSEMAVHPHRNAEVETDLGEAGGRRSLYWVLLRVEEAYIHCAKHVPLLVRADTEIDWGTDDTVKKGGDAFRVAEQRRAARRAPAAAPSPIPVATGERSR